MIVSRTPLRISLFGGGSDIPAFFQSQGSGAVLSMAIDKYIHIVIQKVASPHIKLMYSEIEQVSSVSEIRHDIVKTCLECYGPSSNIEIASFADISTKGTGLGSSSSFAVGLINVLVTKLTGMQQSPEWLAQEACKVEIEYCNKKIGWQDQYAAAFGDLNYIVFKPGGVVVESIKIEEDFFKSLFLVYTGKTRSASEVLDKQVTKLEQQDLKSLAYTSTLRDQARYARTLLEQGKYDAIGELLGSAWEIKKLLSPNSSSPALDQLHNCIINAGASGAKLLGAGAGGYFLAYVPDQNKAKFFQAIPQEKLLMFSPTQEGSKIVYNDE